MEVGAFTAGLLSGASTGSFMFSKDRTVKVPILNTPGLDHKEHSQCLENYAWRDEDFLLLSYMKNGKNFAIISN